ncbi:Flp pilus assembly protein CpaB [Stenotrophomonas sp. HITSZ_GD]|uniref:Flp pilus assembly protein CpaB n=1 Tax=Stenotrophomonas sp. HITSZ_GD TaxID=3037248 RepID=UPI00240DB5DB|nr:Flp pilus assembly protein CpaB [Stenotrophomonas sp. HITSZ_GD]MDG2524442.1 Flp pilus assembly protein CpaB [Stenotrophomonas sp. HITSZ_GD]
MQKATRLAALLLVAFAIVLLLLAMLLGLRARSPSAGPTPTMSLAPAPAHAQVLVAARDLPAGEPLDANDLRVSQVEAMPPGSYAAPSALVGKILSTPVAAGAIISASMLAHGLALELQPGERAIAVPVDELAGAGNRVVPGDYVDVFMNLKSRAREGDDSQNRLLLSRLRVLSYGAQDLGQPPAPQAAGTESPAESGNARADAIAARENGGAASTASTAGAQPARSAVLAVPVAQANRLLLAAQDGKLFLALRHPSDNGSPDESLFPRPRNVLKPRLDLSPELREAAASPENDAYAGIDADALAGREGAPTLPAGVPARRDAAPHRSAAPPLVVIRGTQAGALSPP